MFNAQKYIHNYKDLVNVKQEDTFKHFLKHGLRENRTDNDILFHSFRTKKKQFVLFTNARDESNLKEWCAHHLLLGFDCIYIFDHILYIYDLVY